MKRRVTFMLTLQKLALPSPFVHCYVTRSRLSSPCDHFVGELGCITSKTNSHVLELAARTSHIHYHIETLFWAERTNRSSLNALQVVQGR